MRKNIEEHRRIASDQSLGKSDSELYSKAIELMQKYSDSKSHLDFGSGQGNFLVELKKYDENLQLTAADLMERPSYINKEINWLACDLNGTLNAEDQSFDSATAIEVIEHLENPRHVFRELYRVLKKEGVLILSTPNNESWRAILSYIFRSHFVAFTDTSYPAHITALNAKDLFRCSEEAGFEFLLASYSQSGTFPLLTQYTWQSLSLGILDGMRYTDNIFIVLKK